MSERPVTARLQALRFVPALLLAAVIGTFAALAPGFLAPQNVSNIVVQCSSLAVVASGMTFVLLMGGIDLSVGSVMFLSAAVAGKMALAGQPLALVIVVMAVVGTVCGVVNGLLVVRVGLPAFVVTLATLYAGRGAALYLTQTRAMNLPEELLRLATSSLFGIPVPVWLLAGTTLVAQTALSRTQWGRQLYAAGQSRPQAALAGVAVDRLLLAVYVVSGFAAALGGLIAVAQLGAVSPTFGSQRELSAIAAAVLGGTSLFGGRGRVFPGTILGAVLIQTVESGLVAMNADPYLYPMAMAAIIFVAVLLDSLRTRYAQSLGRRKIRSEAAAGTTASLHPRSS